MPGGQCVSLRARTGAIVILLGLAGCQSSPPVSARPSTVSSEASIVGTWGLESLVMVFGHTTTVFGTAVLAAPNLIKYSLPGVGVIAIYKPGIFVGCA